MLRKFLMFVAMVLVPAAAHAGLLGSALTFNGIVDQINTVNQPNGRSAVVKGAGNVGAGLEAGDIVYGFIGSSSVTNDVTESANPFDPETPVVSAPASTPFGGTKYAAAVFSGVVNIGPPFGGFDTTFLTPVLSGTYAINSLLPSFSGAGQQLDGVNNAVVAVLTGSTAGGVSDLQNVLKADFGTFFNTGFTLEFAATTDGGFFQSEPTLGFNPLPSPGSLFVNGFKQRAGLNVIASTQVGGIGAGIEFKDVVVKELFAPSVSKAQIALDNTMVGLTGASGWDFTVNSSSIRLNAVPEPATAMMFAGLGIAGLITRRRRVQKT